MTPIVRNGVPVAAVLHAPTVVDDTFEHALGAAARLAVENERLHAEVRAQLEALRQSRMRITQRGDAERRRLERDLHDGAQQRLLALFYDLKLAYAIAEGEVAEQLDAAAVEAQLALEELRQLAHGIYPAILTEAGLQPALASLADDAPFVVELDVADKRYDASVEAAVYVAVRESVDDAAARSATSLHVFIEERGEALRLGIEDDGKPRTTDLLHVQDRIGALGGTVEVGQRTLAAVVPCG
jgi:signal transduction histidine kinase